MKLNINDYCPKCKSDNIANEGPENDDGSLDMTCHDCSYQWTDGDDSELENNDWDTLKDSTKKIVKDAILKAAQDRKGPEGYKSNEECLEDVEFKSRDGFSPFSHNKGGLCYRNFTDLMGYWGGGYSPAHEGAAKEVQRQIEYSFNSISEDIYSDHKSLCLELNIGEDECQYHSLTEYLETSENLTADHKQELTKMIDDIQEMECERMSDSESSIMHEFRVMYHG